MKRTMVILLLAALFFFSFSSFAEESGASYGEISEGSAELCDLDDSLSETEEEALLEIMRETVEAAGFSVCIVITDDIGSPKTDRQTIDYADVYYEELCGVDTDGILLLINNDTKYDWISTSGSCIHLFTDARIDAMFDQFYGELQDGEYFSACLAFCGEVEYYAKKGYDFSGEHSSGQTEFYSDASDFTLNPGLLFFVLFGTVFAVVIFVSTVSSRYSLKAQKGAGSYVLRDSLLFSENKDVFIRTYVTRHTVSSGSSGRSGHSSTHRSSGGGRHGGGGRHR